jgi:hypothetical protein
MFPSTQSILRAPSAAAGSSTLGCRPLPHPMPHTPVIGSGLVAAQAAAMEGWRACGGEAPPHGMERPRRWRGEIKQAARGS